MAGAVIREGLWGESVGIGGQAVQRLADRAAKGQQQKKPLISKKLSIDFGAELGWNQGYHARDLCTFGNMCAPGSRGK
jgi:hypothetical protein